MSGIRSSQNLKKKMLFVFLKLALFYVMFVMMTSARSLPERIQRDVGAEREQRDSEPTQHKRFLFWRNEAVDEKRWAVGENNGSELGTQDDRNPSDGEDNTDDAGSSGSEGNAEVHREGSSQRWKRA